MAYDTYQINCLEPQSQTKTSTTNIVLYKKISNQGPVQVNVKSPPILLIKSKNSGKLDKDCIKEIA